MWKIYTRKNLPSRLLPYSLGYCFANGIIYAYENILNKNKESFKLDIKDTIEKFKNFSEEDGIKITEMINALLKNYINIKKMLNIKTNMLSCLLEKIPNIMDNINGWESYVYFRKLLLRNYVVLYLRLN